MTAVAYHCDTRLLGEKILSLTSFPLLFLAFICFSFYPPNLAIVSKSVYHFLSPFSLSLLS